MSLQTGGLASGAISTRSTSASSAIFSAWAIGTMPTCSPAAPIKRTSGALISMLIRCVLSVAMLYPPENQKLSRTPRLRLAAEAGDEVRQGHLPEIFTAAGTHGHLFRCLLFFADDQLVRQLLQAMFPNFIGYFLVPQVGFAAVAGLLQGSRDPSGVIGLPFRNIEHHHLHRRKPQRHGTRVVLDENADEAFHRADDRPDRKRV